MSRTNIYNKILCRILERNSNRQKNIHLRTVMSCEKFPKSFREQTQCKIFKSISDFSCCETADPRITTPKKSSKVRPKRSLIPVPVNKS